jgi:hypothetical protein
MRNKYNEDITITTHISLVYAYHHHQPRCARIYFSRWHTHDESPLLLFFFLFFFNSAFLKMKRTRTASPESSSSRTPSPTPALKQPRPDAETTGSSIECSEGLCAERPVRFESHEALRSHYVTAHSFVCRGVVAQRQDGGEAVGEVLGDGNGIRNGEEEECGKIFPEERLLDLVSTSLSPWPYSILIL